MKSVSSNALKFISLFIAVVILSVCINRCSNSHYSMTLAANSLQQRHNNVTRALFSGLDDGSDWEARFDSMPSPGQKIRINYLGANLGIVFNDSNYRHLEAARSLGIQPVIRTSDLWKARRPLIKTVSNQNIYVDRLNHSLPYLVPEAHALINDIGRAFRDSLQSRGGGDYRIKVTSILRTPETISSLRRRNVNAVEESAHVYATTFDISYAKFICDDPAIPRTQEDLKNLLGEVLFNLREEGRCYVKYERKQGCFHITARPPE